MKVKICGIKHPENLAKMVALKPDFLGFIFYPKSKRYMAETLAPEDLAEIPSSIKKVGVFVNADVLDIMRTVHKYKLDLVQLHGEESPSQCSKLQNAGIKVIKAFGVDDHFDVHLPEKYAHTSDYFLFDTKGKLPGGNGHTFDWNLLKALSFPQAFFLSGGLGPENLDQIPFPVFGVDGNSRLETEPGLKDPELVEAFITKSHAKDTAIH